MEGVGQHTCHIECTSKPHRVYKHVVVCVLGGGDLLAAPCWQHLTRCLINLSCKGGGTGTGCGCASIGVCWRLLQAAGCTTVDKHPVVVWVGDVFVGSTLVAAPH
jgi:hypothetical protein